MRETHGRWAGAVHMKGGGRFGVIAVLLLIASLILPAVALAKLPIDPRIVGGYAAAVSLVAYSSYSHDKARARSNGSVALAAGSDALRAAARISGRPK